MPDIVINNKKFIYQINRRPISSIRISIKSPIKILITCPRLTPVFIIKKFVQSNADWIIKHASEFLTPPKLSSLQKINILGNDYQLLVNKTPRDSVIILEDERKIFVNSRNLTNAYLKNIFEKRLKRLSLVLIKTEIEKIIKEHPFKCRSVSVRNQKTRFGSCSSVGSLNFNWQIIFFPSNIFRHIIFHELVHLKVKNHSHQFWETLGIYDSDWKINNLWLKKRETNILLLSRKLGYNINMKTSHSVFFLLIFILLSSTITWFFIILPVSSLDNILYNASSWINTNLISRYPDDLVISLENGIVTLNRPVPYCLVLDRQTRSGIIFTGDQDPKVLSLTDGTYSSLCTPFALIGNNYYVYPDKENTYRVAVFPTTANFNLDKNQIIKFIDQYLPSILQIGHQVYYFVPVIVTIPLLFIFLCQNLWYFWVAKTIIKLFKLYPADQKTEIYGTSLFIYTIVLFVDWVIIGFILNYTLKQNINLSIPLFNTLVISIGTALTLKSDIQSPLDNGRSLSPPAI